MTQANNRQGGGGTKAPGDGDRPGPGTESNRARAARGGWGSGDVLSVYLDGQRIAGAPMDRVEVGDGAADHEREAKIHALALDVARTTICTYAEARAHVEAMLTERMGLLDAGQVRAVFEGVVGRAQPDHAPGQVWAPPPSSPTPTWTDADGTVAIAALRGGFVRLVGGASVVPSDLDGWTCIGVATPHGRVMVGDGWRRAPDHEFTVTAIASEDGEPWIKVRYAGGQQDHDFDARNLWDCAGYHRTRYAPARAGERYRDRRNGDVANGVPGLNHNPAQWERLDAGRRASAALAQACHEGAAAVRGLAANLRKLDPDGSMRGAPSTLTLQAPAPYLRALFDAIGRALELPATRHACPFGAGLTVTVLRDEMLFTPTAETGIGTADLAGDARALCALRSCVQEAMVTGRGSLAQWGAKGPRVEVVREGPAMGATTTGEPAEPVRYRPSEGGADAWRWGGGGQ